jgi:hypothetical protein
VDGEAAVSELAKWLHSDRPLGRGELLSLAQLIAGELNTPGPRASDNSLRRTLIFEALSRESHLKSLWKKEPPGLDDPMGKQWAAAWIANYKRQGFNKLPAGDALQAAAE